MAVMKKIFIFSLILIITGICILFFSNTISGNEHKFSSRYVDINHESNILKAKLFIPSDNPDFKKPAVVLCHGVIVNKEYMEAMAQTLSENGVIALTFDLGGYGESSKREESEEKNVAEILACVKYLGSLDSVDKKNIGLIGHSMGGTAVVLAGLADKNIKAVACVGMSAELEPFEHCNILWSAGLYDPLHIPREMREATEKSTGNSGYMENEDYTHKGCSHHLFISPTANHQTEMFDFIELKEVTKWFRAIFNSTLGNKNENAIKVSYPFFNWAVTLLGTGVFLLISLLSARDESKRLSLRILAGCIITVLILGNYSIIQPFLASSVIIFLLYLLIFSNFYTPKTHKQVMKLFLLIFIGVACVDIVNIINVAWEYVNNPYNIAYIPIYLAQTWVNYIPLSFLTLRPHLFNEYTSSLMPSWILMLPIILELIRPGIILKTIMPIGNKITAICTAKNIFKKEKTDDNYKPDKKRMIMMLSVLLIILTALIFQRMSAGFISMDAFYAVMSQFIRRYIPTALLAIILIRNIPLFRSL